MTTYTVQNMIGVAQYFDLAKNSIDRADEIAVFNDLLLAALSKSGEIEFGLGVDAAEICEAAWMLQHHDKIYYSPETIDCGLIAANQVYTISLWNAGKEGVTITDISFSSVGGYTFAGNAAPYSLRAEMSRNWILTILVDGPPTQDTVLTFTMSDGEVFTTTITGRRIETFAFPCDAVNGVKVKYQFETLIARSSRFVEQRRSLRSTPTRVLAADFSFFSKEEKEKFINKLYAFREKVIVVPFHPEEFRLTADPIGATTIDLGAAQVANRFAFEVATMLIIYDERDSDYAELLEIESSVAGVVTISSPVIASYDPLYSYIAPAFLCVCPVVSGRILNPVITEFSLEFEEYISG